MIRASYQSRLSALILGLRPSAAHIYGTSPRTPVDNLTYDGIGAWQTGLRLLARDLGAEESLNPTEEWMAEWVFVEQDREATRWADASSVLELLALSLGPSSLDPSHLRPDTFWASWMKTLKHHRQSLDVGRAWFSGDTADFARHCADLVTAHNGPDLMHQMLLDLTEMEATVLHQPDVFRPLTTPVERLQLSAMIASAYDPKRSDCRALERRLFERTHSSRAECTRV